MAYRENNGSRYDDPHKARLDRISLAERTKEERTKKENDTLNFIFAKEDPIASMDLDKVGYARAKPSKLDLEPSTTGDNSIYTFSGEFKFLSPLHKAPVQLPGDPTRTYASIEHALAASKTSDMQIRDTIVAEEDPLNAKRIGSKCHTKNNDAYNTWKDGSLNVMRSLVRDKFRRNPKYRERLIGTGHRQLIYRVDHNDQYWGTVEGKGGLNHYGKILMEVRNEFRGGKDLDNWLSSHFDILPDQAVEWSVEVTRNGKRLTECDVTCNGGVIYMGKLAGCEIMAEHPTCSRKHAVLVACRRLGACLVDLGTANGTKVNGEVVAPFTAIPLGETSPTILLAHSSRSFIVSLNKDAETSRRQNLYARLGAAEESGGDGQTEFTAFIAHLPLDTTVESLTSWLLTVNPQITKDAISRVTVPRSKDNENQARGIAFVSFKSSHGLLQCISLDGESFGENSIKVKKADKPKTNDKGGTGGGGGGGEMKEKTGICFDFKKGTCTRGANCRFKHEEDERDVRRGRDRGGQDEGRYSDQRRRYSSRSRSPKRSRRRSHSRSRSPRRR